MSSWHHAGFRFDGRSNLGNRGLDLSKAHDQKAAVASFISTSLRTKPGLPIEYQTLKTNLTAYNRILKKTIRNAKSLHYRTIFTQSRNDPKQTWNAINNILNRNTKTDTNIEYLMKDNTRINFSKDITNHLNEFFTNIGQIIGSKIPSLNSSIDSYLQQTNNQVFDFVPITPTEIDIIIDNIKPKHSTGQDISTTLIKYLKFELRTLLTFKVNQMIAFTFPDTLKIAKVKPLFKKGDKHLCQSYRPISLLYAISKNPRKGHPSPNR
ncbi:hypothetical protein CAPTEDRAFT_191405 [Capitella teleta]|uniref:Reverse transcriptase domain-containing protein n=1 Tax=Capitella teleta TaxID=283909 RepID=R7THZ8_CAPTE|nr:hypothetical protein CAPTEDRAFT_191405 [Capitella teleta]|eukprot:ELT93448.1 hypothetical protein CAPTEDRAFT_191405 [Capitella teleta]